MLIIISIFFLLFIAFILFCIVHCSTSYDRSTDDEQQERFIDDVR